MKNLLCLTMCICLSALFTVKAQAAESYRQAYDGLLRDYVHAASKSGIDVNLVDYTAWGKDPRHAQAMNALAEVSPSTLSLVEAKTFWINAYNLLTIDLITKNPEIKSIKDLGTLLQSPWKAHSWKIAGKDYTLDQIEHDILRKMHDPRIHMAIVCASLSCPDLRNESFREKTLNSQLSDQAQKFLSNPTKGMKIGAAGLTLSPIFKWFIEDFGDEKDVLKFVRKYDPAVSSDATIDGYFSYDWNLNKP